MSTTFNGKRLRNDFEKVYRILEEAPSIDKHLVVEEQEFRERHARTAKAVQAGKADVGFVFSDEHYCGDVPYLGGNTNISIEQVAGVVGKDAFHIIAGLEGGYVAEQLSGRSGAVVHKAEILQLADEKYPVAAERLDEILACANCGKVPQRIALLTPRQVIPAFLVEQLEELVGRENLIDMQEDYQRIKYIKSDREIELTANAGTVADTVMRGMLAVLRPGLLETQVAAWGYFIAREMGCEELGFDIMVGANEANRTLIGKALNREIEEGDYVHLGVGTKCDGLNACVRRSAIAVKDPDDVSRQQRYWLQMVEDAYNIGYNAYEKVAHENLPARLQEQALVEYFEGRSEEVSRLIGRKVELALQKPYTGTHNAGYTECQEFYGAITLDSMEPLGEQIVTMLDVALRGIGDHWNDIRIPGLDFVVIENTLAKRGREVSVMTNLPLNVQHMVGHA